MSGRGGPQKAICALAASILTPIYHGEIGSAASRPRDHYLHHRTPDAKAKRLVAQLAKRIGIDSSVWDHSRFSKNRDRLLEGEIAAKFLAAVLPHPRVKRLLSSANFSVHGTLI